jgi:hypothetical protein
MKKLTIVLLIIPVISVYSQQKKYFDAPFGGGVGYVPAWYIPNLEPINNELKNIGLSDLSTSGFYSSGGGGFIYLGFIKYLRVGGMGYSGSVSTSAEYNGIKREVIYNLGGGGLTFEYTLPIVKDIGLSVGAAVGAGSLEIQVYKNNKNISWDDIWNGTEKDSTANLNRSLKNNYWTFTPTINLDYPINRFILIRLGVGYQLTFADSWKADNENELRNVPSDLNANAFFVQSGLFVGFFSF